jgi:hypothetical protein
VVVVVVVVVAFRFRQNWHPSFQHSNRRPTGYCAGVLNATKMRMTRNKPLATLFGHRQGLMSLGSVRGEAIYDNLETTSHRYEMGANDDSDDRPGASRGTIRHFSTRRVPTCREAWFRSHAHYWPRHLGSAS